MPSVNDTAYKFIRNEDGSTLIKSFEQEFKTQIKNADPLE